MKGDLKRGELWIAYDKSAKQWAARDHAPAFVQEITVGGLWCIQELVRPRERKFGWFYRLFHNPPCVNPGEPFYNGWPGDHRGWLKFQTKEEARDFYKFATRRISMDEYCALPHRPYSGYCINLDERGDFAGDRP